VISSDDGTCKLWEVASGALTLEFKSNSDKNRSGGLVVLGENIFAAAYEKLIVWSKDRTQVSARF